MIDGSQCGHDDCCKECKWYEKKYMHGGICLNPEYAVTINRHGAELERNIVVRSYEVCDKFEEKL